jgi:hypothetical protein
VAGWPVRVRQVVNLVNLSTPLGLLIAVATRSRLSRGPHGLILAKDSRLPKLSASAITVGDVVLVRISDQRLAERGRLLDHEARHATQYAVLLGPFGFFPAYLLASAWSWWHTRGPAQRNLLERGAGLLDGGYTWIPDDLPEVDWQRRSRWAQPGRYRRRRRDRQPV